MGRGPGIPVVGGEQRDDLLFRRIDFVRDRENRSVGEREERDLPFILYGDVEPDARGGPCIPLVAAVRLHETGCGIEVVDGSLPIDHGEIRPVEVPTREGDVVRGVLDHHILRVRVGSEEELPPFHHAASGDGGGEESHLIEPELSRWNRPGEDMIDAIRVRHVHKHRVVEDPDLDIELEVILPCNIEFVECDRSRPRGADNPGHSATPLEDEEGGVVVHVRPMGHNADGSIHAIR